MNAFVIPFAPQQFNVYSVAYSFHSGGYRIPSGPDIRQIPP